jgi:PAS domain S-box-containing protein
MTSDENVDTLKSRIQQLENDLAQRNQTINQLNEKLQTASQAGQASSELSEAEDMLRRMMTRTAMILQGSRCMAMIYDNDTNELVADSPAVGFDDLNLSNIRNPATVGISGECFQNEKPVIFFDVTTDARAQSEKMQEWGVMNGLAMPLVFEKRDEETNKVVERKKIGVLHVFNKKFGSVFTDEDVQLATRLAGNMASVINASAGLKKVTKEKEELVETIDALYVGLIMVNKNGRIAQMNTSARQLFGIPKDEVFGTRTYNEIITNEAVSELIGKAIADETGISEEIQLPDPKTPEVLRTFSIESAQVRNENNEAIGTAAIFNDITQLRNIDKMKTAFVSTVSHELRTPLTSIKGFISMLLADAEEVNEEYKFKDEERLEFCSIIDKECDRLKRLIDDLLNVSRIESGKAMELNVDTFDFAEAFNKAMTIQQGSTWKKTTHELTHEIDANVPKEMIADADKVEQIIANLVGNSLKYSPGGGKVHVQATMADADTLHVKIKDEGMGMTPEFIARIGERFLRADNRDTREIGGTGIGLFLVKHLVEAHGGQMWAESEGAGKGSTFHFTLPTKPHEDAGNNLSGSVAG